MKSPAIGFCLVLVGILFAAPVSAGLFSSDPVLPAGAKVERDLAYGPDDAQRMDVYIPPHPQGAPVILMVHGGAWAIGDKDMGRVVDNKVAHWLPKGVIFVTTNYRMVPVADPLIQADDVAKALAFVQAKAASWGGDPARVVLMGHSAGAHLVALLTADPSIAAGQGAKSWLGTVVLDSGALDVGQIMRRSHYRFYDRAFGADPAYWDKASPTLRLTAKPQPMLVVCSTKRDDSCPPSRDFVEKATALGGRASLLQEPLTHREINENVGLPGDYTKAVDAFLRSLGVS
ncbi:alpha/beta hydrolase [Parvibaculum sp.]|uniref:alpha/beta hydrolase n=1 Tax=Parvibaculum sp. TaxID=2024848 RepID=UPI002BC06E70|nr:alpha/beta hydrolase [Parvibaculum sp.]HUD52195.1 alpha/beta hydrolase [Parvibaculum sp.]